MKIEEEEEKVDIAEQQLRQWVRAEVEKDERVERRRAQLAQVEDWVKQKERETTYTRQMYSNACESVLECESVMKGLYGMLGLEYRDTDSEEEEGAKSTDNIINIAEKGHDDVEVESDEDDYIVIDLGASVPESVEHGLKVEEVSTTIQSSDVLDSRVTKPEIVPPTIMPPSTSAPYKNITEFFKHFNNGLKMSKDLSPPRSPEQSLDSLQTIKTSESPVPISSVPSPSDSSGLTLQKESPPSLLINPSKDEPMEPRPLTVPCAPTNETEHLETSASEPFAYTEQDSDASLQPLASTKPTPVKSALASGLSGKILINTTLASSGKNSSTHSGKTTTTEKAKTGPKPGNNPSTSATCSTTTPLNTTKKATTAENGKVDKTVSSIPTAKTKVATSSTTVSPQHTEVDATSSAKPSQLVPSNLTSFASPDSTGGVDLKVNMNVLGKRRTKTWHQGTIVEIRTTETGHRYKVQFEGGKGKSMLSGHHLACVGSPMLKDLFVGCRVVASYKEEHQSWLHAAVVAEMPDRKNRMRFLVFFDDGRPAYVALPDLHLVCAPLSNVCEDIEDEACRAQVQEYLQMYPNPIFVVVQVGQEGKAEREGKMESCTITQLDGSLVQVCYKKDEEKEWLYKGSNRLEHIQRVKKMVGKKKEQSSNQGRNIQRNNNLPTNTTTTAATSTTCTAASVAFKPSASQSVPRPVATVTTPSFTAKATIPISQPKVTLRRINVPTSTVPTVTLPKITMHADSTVMDSSKTGIKRPAAPEEDIQSTQAPVVAARLKYAPHRCCPACLDQTRPERKDGYRGQNPLLIPLLYGFRRITAKRRLDRKVSFHVFYRSPCGRSMCTMEEVQNFLFESRCDYLFLEMFCLDPFVLVRRAPLPSSTTCRSHMILPDISEGKEVVPVSCVNEVDSKPPPPVTYVRHRAPGPGVFINTSPDFMTGCDCTDGCRDRSKCSCHQLTVEATALFPGGPVDASAGYTHKRLTRDLPTGLYECNPLCRCDPWMCSNRLVQHGQQLRLQVFMTQHKGWGIRCLDDLSKGTFVCVFTGKIITDEMVSMEQPMSGNEFLANLDFIEGVEKLKEGYESEAYCSDKDGDSEKKTLVTMTTGALKRHAVYQRDSESDSGSVEEKENPDQQKMKEKGWTGKRHKREAGDKQDHYSDYDNMDEDYRLSTDDEVEFKYLNVDCRKSYTTRRNVKIMDDLDDSALETSSSIPTSPKPISKISEDQMEVTAVMDKQTRKNDPGHRVMGLAKKSTRPFAVKSAHRKVKPGEVPKHQGKTGTYCESTRSLFGGEMTCYLIDAKREGNIARYINHSCSPNLFVQNVFVDTHDIRFPWVAFFTSKRIRAGTELTWDYSYEVGSVEGKVLLCCCGSDECTGRLL